MVTISGSDLVPILESTEVLWTVWSPVDTFASGRKNVFGEQGWTNRFRSSTFVQICPFLFHFCSTFVPLLSDFVRNVCTNRHCAGGQAASCVTWGMRILSESMMPLMLENGKDCRKGVRECAAGAGGRPARYIETDTGKEEGERL